MTDYYEALGISREAEADEIAKAFRRYSMAYNPQCHPDHPDPQVLMQQYKLVCQAYSILSEPKIKAVYDLYGEEGVRHGGAGNQGFPGGLDIDAIEPQAVFKKFFGVDNPFQVVGNVDGVQNNQHDFFSHVAALPKRLPKCAPLEVKLPITLEDVYYGAMRTASWKCQHTRKLQPVSYSTESFELRVEKGAKNGDRFTIEGKGNTAHEHARGDVIVLLELQPHERFRREGNNLVMVVPISLAEALCGTTIVVRSMEGRQLSVLIDEIVHPKFRTRIVGEGLPESSDQSSPRGDLIIECATQFPSFLTLEQKSELRRILDAK